MNILPKKSWHVRNKDNIERVRRDEEKAATEENERLKRVAIAESEARTELLRQKSRSDTTSKLESSVTSITQHHINFFEDCEQGKKLGGKNTEHEEEKRLEKEKQEKAIGLLTYLGQGSVELEATKPWYFKPPEKRKSDCESTGLAKSRDEFDAKKKQSADPLRQMTKFIDVSQKVRKLKDGTADDVSSTSHKRHKGEDTKNTCKSVEQLRAERLRREQMEHLRAEQLLAKMRGDVPAPAKDPMLDDRQRRYNSQFNPDIARRPRPNE
jgi:hypothetical protein